MFGKHLTLLTGFIATFYRQNVKCWPVFAKNIEKPEIHENGFSNSPILETEGVKCHESRVSLSFLECGEIQS